MLEASTKYGLEHQREANSLLWFQNEKCQGLVGLRAEGKELNISRTSSNTGPGWRDNP